MPAARAYVEKRFGASVDFRDDPIISTIGTTDDIFLNSYPDRLAFTVVNLSASAVFIRPGLAASATTGIRLGPNGGSAVFSVDTDMILTTLEWHIIGAATSLAFYTTETFAIEVY